ncbi:MAG: Kef family K(+) transporter [Azoarcus sp.]|jgi:CPA2 family monovalent cation:H+ antiporter-2|nr:Kef family K(+) transporter [Azoarcus sp.]
MEHNLSLISTIASGFGMALVLGLAAERLRVPALVGYLVAGVILGPATPGIVADMSIASQLSEIGVMLLMFGVGLHFSLGDLLAVKRIAIPGAVAQMGLATLLGALLAKFWGWNWGSAFVFGLSLSCASTVVLLKALEAQGALESMNGRIAVGWLVVEDLATVLALVLLPPLAGLLGDGGEVMQTVQGETAAQASLWTAIGVTLLRVSAFLALMLVAGRRLIPWLLWHVARTGSRELFTLSVVAIAIGIAYGAAEWFRVSFALGAFFAGMVMRESQFSHRAAAESLPLRDAFSVLFFVAVGMLFEPGVLLEAPFKTFAVVMIIIVGKSLAAAALVLAFRYPLRTALTVAVSLAQIGEFSFILAGLGMSLGLLEKEGMSLILAASLIAIALNPLLFAAIPALQRWLLGRYEWARRLDRRETPFDQLPMSTDHKVLEGQVVLVGYGRVGQRVAGALAEHGVPFVIAEQNRECVEDLRKKGIAAVCGDASEPAVLIQAHVANAAMLVVATPSPLDVRKMAETARTLNPNIEIVVRTHNDEEAHLLSGEGIGAVFFGEEELARSMSRHVVERFSPGVQSR